MVLFRCARQQFPDSGMALLLFGSDKRCFFATHISFAQHSSQHFYGVFRENRKFSIVLSVAITTTHFSYLIRKSRCPFSKQILTIFLVVFFRALQYFPCVNFVIYSLRVGHFFSISTCTSVFNEV